MPVLGVAAALFLVVAVCKTSLAVISAAKSDVEPRSRAAERGNVEATRHILVNASEGPEMQPILTRESSHGEHHGAEGRR